MISPKTLAAGERISIVLHPNHDILDTNDPEYRESYALPFVFSDGEYVAGATFPCHFVLNNDEGFQTISFTYTNSMNYYGIVFPSEVNLRSQKIGVKFMSIHQYRKAEFITRPAGQLVFEVPEGENGRQTPRDHGMADSIARGDEHYLAVQLNEHRIWMLPIDISYDYYESSRFEFRTKCTLNSVHVVSPGAFRESLMEADPETEAKFETPEYGFLLATQLVPTYLHIFDDGTYYTPASERSGTKSQYRWAKIFAYP